MDLNSSINEIPSWAILSVTGALFLAIGIVLARKIWGKNAERLKRALDESAYLAGQWATLGISQSQLVEKLGKKVFEAAGESGEKEIHLTAALRERDSAIERLEGEVGRLEEARSILSEREVSALQIQVEEIQKRDNRILTLENRLQHLDAKNQQNAAEHQERVKVLLERIEGLEQSGGGKPDALIQENNKQLTELLKQRCQELEVLRDGLHTKERALTKLREQNAVLKKGVDDLVAGWSKKKGEVEELGQLKARLAETTEELTKVKRDYEVREAEIDLMQSDSISVSGIPADLAAAKHENDEVKEELKRSSAQIDMLLDVIENRDRRVEELEAQVSSGSKSSQILTLSQTIADLQSKVNEAHSDLAKNNEELEARNLQLSILKSKLGDGDFGDVEFDEVFSPGTTEFESAGRFLSESKSGRIAGESFGGGGKSVVYFGENSAFIKSENSKLISEIAKEIGDSGARISLIGFSENEGNGEFNEALSVRRAEAVREQFREAGVDSSLVEVKGKGEDAEFSGTGEAWKARRVEIVILPMIEAAN